MTIHRHILSVEHPVAIEAYLDDVSATGSLQGVSATLANITALAAVINLEVNTRKLAQWPGLRPNSLSTPHTLIPLLEGLNLILLSFDQATFMQTEIDNLLER